MLPLLLKKNNVPLYIRYTISARCGETKFGTAQKEHKITVVRPVIDAIRRGAGRNGAERW